MPENLQAAMPWTDKARLSAGGDTDHPGEVPLEAPPPGHDTDAPGRTPDDLPPAREEPNEPGDVPPETPPPPD